MKVEKQRDIWIDTLRGIAAFGVMIAHLAVTFPNIGVRGSGTGKIFVCLFMCITGYYAFSNIDRDKWGIKEILLFYLKKIETIIPQFLVCLLLGTLFGLYDMKIVGKTLTFQMGLMHFWYIPVVLGFYLIIPFIRRLLSLLDSKRRIWILVALIIVFEVLFPWFHCTENSIEFWWYIPSFLIGSLARMISNHYVKENICYDIGTIICVLIFILIIPGIRESVFSIPSDGYLQNKLVFMTLLWGCLIIFMKKSKYIFRIVNKSNIFSKNAKYGYSLYLIHYIVLNVLYSKGICEWKLVFWTIVISSFGAIGLYWGIQYPLQCLMKKVTRKSN